MDDEASKKRPLDTTNHILAPKRAKLGDDDVDSEEGRRTSELFASLPKYVQQQHSQDTSFEAKDTIPISEPAAVAPEQTRPAKPLEFQKRKVVMICAYLGDKYQGLQKNYDAITIEGVLEYALSKADVIADIRVGLDWMRAARTDKGVSAVGNHISFNMLMAPDAIDKINALLPDDVRVFGVHRVGRKFSAKDWCHARTYSYVLPTAVMAPRSPAPGASPFVFDTEARQRLNELLREYKGTHYFHNFTVKMEPKSSKSQRFIMDFSCGEPFVRDGAEFVSLTVTAQSFVLHQIRKMIAVAVACMRDNQSPAVIRSLFAPIKQANITMAPGEGLCLMKCHFDNYNSKVEAPNEPINWGPEIQAKLDEFYNTRVLEQIVRTENEKHLWTEFLKMWDRYPMNYQAILNSAASYVPTVSRKTQRRAAAKVAPTTTLGEASPAASTPTEPITATESVTPNRPVPAEPDRTMLHEDPGAAL